ncbi:efflux transporter outer membrane subunit [Chitiniphilus shinanonensis]|uniref:efflux transporter outer membrane subunit n=1 Tax=Chitiniphilus shinanonensis TaxID=553088 RepID=UPI00305FC209
MIPLGKATPLPLLFAALAGCALQPAPDTDALRGEQLPMLTREQAWRAASQQGEVADDWLKQFHDATLEALVAEAVAHNRDLQLAAARVDEARAQMAINGGELYPAVGVRGLGGNSETQVLSVAASWELDLWGRVRSQARAAESQYAASETDLLWAREVVVATTARAWFALLQYRQLIAQQQMLVDTQQRLLGITRQRISTGIAPATEEQESQVALRQRQDELRQLQLAERQAAQAMEILLGRYPAGELAAAGALPALPPPPPAGLPAELLERRPDLIAAERRVAAAFDLKQSARAARLPRISIGAAITWVDSDLFLLNSAESPVKGLTGSFLAPLFTGGQLQGQVDFYDARQKQAAIAYGTQALAALKDVEGSLLAEAAYRDRARLLDARLTEQQTLLRREEVRVKVGSRDPRSVLDREQSLTTTRMEQLQLQTAQLNQRVTLLLALGGSWTATAAASRQGESP